MPERTFPEICLDNSDVSRKLFARILLARAAVADRYECFSSGGHHSAACTQVGSADPNFGALTDGGRLCPKATDSVA
jgi:hypothetical protein